MYLARRCINGRTGYFIAQSYAREGRMASRDLLALGPHPEKFIIYPGGNSYYIDEAVGDGLRARGIEPDIDDLEALFLPFVRADIRRIIDPLRERAHAMRPRRRLSAGQQSELQRQLDIFDKRRVHFIRFGQMNQGTLEGMPAVLLKNFYRKSRDEIEQDFMRLEQPLKASELKAYVYVIFDLQRFFTQNYARTAPQLLDPDEVDACFLKEVCRLNRRLFAPGAQDSDIALNEYMQRYLCMFFDNNYPETSPFAETLRQFMNRHRDYQPPVRSAVSLTDAAGVFGVPAEILKKMSARELSRRYRRLARRHHPDRGGSHDKFIELNAAFQSLIRGKRSL